MDRFIVTAVSTDFYPRCSDLVPVEDILCASRVAYFTGTSNVKRSSLTNETFNSVMLLPPCTYAFLPASTSTSTTLAVTAFPPNQASAGSPLMTTCTAMINGNETSCN